MIVISDDNNLIDYFLEIGAKPEIFKNKDLYEPQTPEAFKLVKPSIISKFPSFDKRHIVLETSIVQQIFPQNFGIIKSEKKPKSKFYCIILDMMNIMVGKNIQLKLHLKEMLNYCI